MLCSVASRGRCGHEVIDGFLISFIFFSAGLYPEIPEASQLDFSALKEEVLQRLASLPKNLWLCCILRNSHHYLFCLSVVLCPFSLCLIDRVSGFSSSITSSRSLSSWTNRDSLWTVRGEGPELTLRLNRSVEDGHYITLYPKLIHIFCCGEEKM